MRISLLKDSDRRKGSNLLTLNCPFSVIGVALPHGVTLFFEAEGYFIGY